LCTRNKEQKAYCTLSKEGRRKGWLCGKKGKMAESKEGRRKG